MSDPDLSHIFPLERVLRRLPLFWQSVALVGFVLALQVLGAWIDSDVFWSY